MLELWPAPQWLVKLCAPWAERIALTTLSRHIHQVILAYIVYHVVDHLVSPLISRALFAKSYNGFTHHRRRSWDAHVVSLVQSLLICTAALRVVYADEDRWAMGPEERVWGYTSAMGEVQALSVGYFLWDFVTSAASPELHHGGAALHAAAALALSLFGFRPFCNYYGINLVLFELSTPFLNVHWFLEKLGHTGSTFQVTNGALLITSFFACRIVWGNYQNGCMFRDIFAVATRDGSLPVPFWLAGVYILACSALSYLNLVWFAKMIKTVRESKPVKRA